MPVRIFTTVLLAALAVAPAAAETDHRLALMGGAGAWLHPESGYHAAFMVAYDVEGLPRGSHFHAGFNTDTVRLEFDRLRVLNGLLEFGIRAAYEFNFAGLLMDYYRLGVDDSSRGFNASYLTGELHAKLNLPGDHYLELAAGARRWFFKRQGGTADELVLPPEVWVFEPRLRYTFWRLQNDPSLRDRHRLFPRVVGLAAGVELGLDLRSETVQWGAYQSTHFSPPDPRNDPGDVIFSARQWLRAGWQLHNRVRAQIAQFASYGHGEDDLSRVRLGGLNPYVVPLAGAPWAAFISEKFLAAESTWHFRVFGEIEAGLVLHGMLIEDIERTGRTDTYDFAFGLGAFIDARFGDFQVDLRGGWSPTLDWQDSSGQFALFASAGWQWD